ncbi:nucleoporin complex subunit 54-domain-containing protein [Entophlyctis helioformis]|nr:nucleoporin complex subunit 54-domain-containing protein [Entophlyctis helioformis]
MPAAGGMFGAPQPAAGGMFGSGMGLGMQQQQQQLQLQQQQQQQPQITDDIQRMAAYWNPQNPMCNFKVGMILLHASAQSWHSMRGRRTDSITFTTWCIQASCYKQAQMNNPDPSCMVPVAAVGFGDLKKRMEVQEKHQAMQKDALEMMSARVDAIQRKHYVDTVIKLEEYKRRQRQIVHKVFMLMKQVQMLRNRGFSIRADEEALRSRLEAMERDLQKPSIFRGRLNEIWAKLQQLKDSKRISEDQGFAVVDEESLAPVAETLSGMTSGLAHVTQVLQSDLRKVDIMRQGYEQSAFARK